MSGKFVVTERAQHPARMDGTCFYCRQVIGTEHKSDCVLVVKKVKVRLVVEYEIEVPATWSKSDVELLRDDGPACLESGIPGISDGIAKFECVDDQGTPYLTE